MLDGLDLNQIFCFESERQIQHNWTFSYEGQLYQVKKSVGEAIAPRRCFIITTSIRSFKKSKIIYLHRREKGL